MVARQHRSVASFHSRCDSFQEDQEKKDGPVVTCKGGQASAPTRHYNKSVTQSTTFSSTLESIFILIFVFLLGARIGSLMNLYTLPNGVKTLCTNSKYQLESSSHPRQKGPRLSSYYHGHNNQNDNNNQHEKRVGDNQNKTMIAYLSQGPAKSYKKIAKRFDNLGTKNTLKFFYHSFDENCTGCIYQGGTTFAEGRNLALKAAVMSPHWHLFKYIVFFDDDVVFHQRINTLKKSKNSTEEEIDSWRTYHKMLLEEDTDYPIMKPRCGTWDPEGESLNFQSCTDDSFVAIRYDHIDFFYPYSTIGKECFWLNIQAIWVRMERCFPAGVLVDPRWIAENPEHRYDTGRAGVYGKIQWQQHMVLEILQRDYPTLGPWYIPDGINELHRCTVKKSPSIGLHPECKKASEQRFQNWISGDYQP